MAPPPSVSGNGPPGVLSPPRIMWTNLAARPDSQEALRKKSDKSEAMFLFFWEVGVFFFLCHVTVGTNIKPPKEGADSPLFFF